MVVRRCRSRAFTLIELLLVMVILVVLAGIMMPSFHGRGETARRTAASADIKSISTALAAFEIDCGRYPTTEEGLAVLARNPGLPGWRGPYLPSDFIDPWNSAYVYESPGTHQPESFDLYSMGRDNRPGADDLVNWIEPATALARND